MAIAELIEHPLAAPSASPAMWSRTGLAIAESATVDDWVQIGRQLKEMDQSLMWWVGDWVRFGERRYGDKYEEAIKRTGYDYDTIAQAKWVAGKYDFCERTQKLSWTHHKVAAKLPNLQRQEVLFLAENNGWSTRALRDEMVRRAVGLPVSPDVDPAAIGPTANPHVDRIVRRTNRIVLAAFCDWFGIGEEYGRILMALYQASGDAMSWMDLSRAVSTHAPMARGAVHEAVSSLRKVFDVEAIDTDEGGYSLTEIGFAECRRAFRELGAQLIGMGREPANDLSPLSTRAEA